MLAALGFVSVPVEYSLKQHSAAARNSVTASEPLPVRGVAARSKACDGRSSASAVHKARLSRRGDVARGRLAAVRRRARGGGRKPAPPRRRPPPPPHPPP